MFKTSRGRKLAWKCLSPTTRLVSGLTMTKQTVGYALTVDETVEDDDWPLLAVKKDKKAKTKTKKKTKGANKPPTPKKMKNKDLELLSHKTKKTERK